MADHDALAPPEQEDETTKGQSGQQQLYRFANRRPAEVEEGHEDKEEYERWRETTDLRDPYRLPNNYLASTRYMGREVPEAPLIVFINSRSGGHAGPRLTEVLCRALGQAQVFDLQHFRPGPVLKQIWANFDEAIRSGDTQAELIRSRFKILCAGGDGTVAWILGTIHKLGIQPAPQVAVMPLGTGNDLSLTFGWGNAFLDAWIKKHTAVYSTLKRIALAEQRSLDIWSVSFTASERGMFGGLPHGLEAPETSHEEGPLQVSGMFWNYFSVGMDAKAAYGFHSLRERRPWAASGRAMNQAWYGYYSLSSGWFCSAPALRNKATLQVRDEPGAQWRTVKLSSAIKALVVLNLQSYAGGRDLWGLSDTANDGKRGWKEPIFNDGLFEIVGLKSGWHAAAVMGTSQFHGVRLAHAAEMRLELLAHGGAAKGDRGMAHMQLDGEPWAQAIPSGSSQPLVMEVKQAGQSSMLANPNKLASIAPKINKLAAREFKVGKSEQHHPHLQSNGSAAASQTPPAGDVQPWQTQQRQSL